MFQSLTRFALLVACLWSATSTTAAPTTYSACGVSSAQNFKTWVQSFETKTPLVFPQDEASLRKLVRSVGKKKGCRIRVVGTGGSVDGVVHQKTENNVVAVNLADMATHPEWDQVLTTENGRIRIGAGRTLLDLMSIARPMGFILPTRTYGRYFTVGGVFMNPTVHGASLGADRLAKLVTGVRVLLSNGNYKDITKESELVAWRGSLGLLGIVVAVEIQLQRDTGILHRVIEKAFPTFNTTEISGFLVSTLAQSNAAHFFYNVYSENIIALTVNNTADPSFDYTTTSAFYEQQKMMFPNMSKTGLVPIDPAAFGEMLNSTDPATIGATVATMTEHALRQSWQASNIYGRDGFVSDDGSIFRIDGVSSLVKCPIDCIQDGTLILLMLGTREVLKASMAYSKANPFAEPWYPTAMVSFRFIHVSDTSKMLLENLEQGVYVNFEIEQAKGLFKGHGTVFRRLERFWQSARANPKAHLGKEWGWDRLDCLGTPFPFQNTEYIKNFYSTQTRKKFIAAMKKYDRKGLFRAGAGLRLLGLGNTPFEPRGSLGDSCSSPDMCLQSCCCSGPLCALSPNLNKCVACDYPYL